MLVFSWPASLSSTGCFSRTCYLRSQRKYIKYVNEKIWSHPSVFPADLPATRISQCCHFPFPRDPFPLQRHIFLMCFNFSMVFVSCLERLSWCQDEFFMFSRFSSSAEAALASRQQHCCVGESPLPVLCVPLTTAPRQEPELLIAV